MELPAHEVARTGVRYEVGSDPANTPEKFDEDPQVKNEHGFYMALANWYCFLYFKNRGVRSKDGVDRHAANTTLKAVDGAFATYGVVNPATHSTARHASTDLRYELADALRECVAEFLKTHFDRLFNSSYINKDNRDALYAMYDAANPGWRKTRRHDGTGAPPDVPTAFATGKQRLLVAALDAIQQRRPEGQQERPEASRLEVNIAAHLFCAFIYLYRSDADPDDGGTPQLERIYGPHWDTYEESGKLLRISILVFPDANDAAQRTYLYKGNEPYAHRHEGDHVRPVRDGDGEADETIEARVSIIGGLGPLALALRKEQGTSVLEDNTAITDLMKRGRLYLRRPGEDRPMTEAGARAARAQEREIRAASVRRRQNAEALAERSGNGITRSGYPRLPRKLGPWADANDDQKKPWTPQELLDNEELASYYKIFTKKMKEYGSKQDEIEKSRWEKEPNSKPKRRNLEKYQQIPPGGATSWWEYNNLTKLVDNDDNPRQASKAYKDAQARLAKKVWLVAQGVHSLPDYKRVVYERGKVEVAQLSTRRTRVQKWMLGHMRRPNLPGGVVPRSDDELARSDTLRCQAARHFDHAMTLTDHTNLQYTISKCDERQKREIDDEYADFMAAERRLLMNVLKSVPSADDADALEAAYNADAASFVACASDPYGDGDDDDDDDDYGDPDDPDAAPKGALTPRKFKRELKKDGQKYQMDRIMPWRNKKGNYAPARAKKLVAKADKNSNYTIDEPTDATTNCGPFKPEDMPSEDEEPDLYNAAFVRFMEFTEELYPRSNKDFMDKSNNWHRREAFWRDPLIDRTDLLGDTTNKRTKALLTKLLERFFEYGKEHHNDFAREDKMWADYGQRYWESKDVSSSSFKLMSIMRALFCDLLACFPERKEGEGELNGIMQFVAWYYQNILPMWNFKSEQKKDKEKDNQQAYLDMACRFFGLPRYSTFNVKKGEPRYSVRRKVDEKLQQLGRAVYFVKLALDFAVLDRDGPLFPKPPDEDNMNEIQKAEWQALERLVERVKAEWQALQQPRK